jgi:bromodomain adjacent to zinc finger domain protein 1A
LCNSLVWTCAYTGHPGLTFQEALDSEQKAKDQLAAFPSHLKRPLLYSATLTHRSQLNDMNDDIYLFAKDRFFIGEIVDTVIGNEK